VTALVLASVVALHALPAVAGPGGPDPLGIQLVGRRCLLFRYIASHRNAGFGYKDDLRRPVTTYIEGPRTRYVAHYLLEFPKELERRQLDWYDARLGDRPGLRGFAPGDVAVVTKLERKGEETEVEIRGDGSDERKGKIVFRLPAGMPAGEPIMETIWRVLLPQPPYASREDETRAMAAVVHGMPLTALADWMRLSPEDAITRVADATLDLSRRTPAEAEALRRCYVESYVALSDRGGIALVRIDLRPGRDGPVLEVEGRAHQLLPGEWRRDDVRGEAAFETTVARIVRTLPRKWTGRTPTAYSVAVEYDFMDRDGVGRDRLESEFPAEVAIAYADLKMGTRALAAQGDHRLNGKPLVLGPRTAP